MDNTSRQDELEDSRTFVDRRYNQTIDRIFETLTEEDRLTVQEQRSWLDTETEFRKKVQDMNSSPELRRLISSIISLSRTMAILNGSFISAVAPHNVQFNFLWGLVHLNLKLSCTSIEKLKRTIEWLENLRRVVELFNCRVDVCEDSKELRLAMIDFYDHILNMLAKTLHHLRSCPTDAEAKNAWPQINAQLTTHLISLDATIKHLNKVTSYSVVNLQQNVENMSLKHAAVPEAEENTSFPCALIPFQQNDKFYGRDAETKNIINYLSPKEDTSDLRTYTIYGRRGIGKTEIALHYAYENLSGFDAIFWIQCETSVSIRQSFTDVAVALNLPNATRNGNHECNLLAVHKWLKLTKKKWLLIFDNAEEDSILKYYLPVGVKGAILITSRHNYNFMKDNQNKGDAVKPFNDQQSFDLLMILLGEQWQNRLLQQSEITAAKTLLQKLGGLGLAIHQAAVLIKNLEIGGSTISRALELFNSNAQRLLLLRPNTGQTGIIHALDNLWDMNFGILNPNAWNLLSVLVMLSPDKILIDLFLPKNQFALSGKLSFIQQQSHRYADDSYSALPNVIESQLLEDAINELLEKGLIRKDQRNITVPRVVQEAMNYYGVEDLQASFEAAGRIINEAFPKILTGESLRKAWPIISHGMRMYHKYNESTNPLSRAHIQITDTFTALIASSAWYLYEVGDYSTALRLAETMGAACVNKDSARYQNPANLPRSSFHPDTRRQRQKIKRGLPGFVNGSKVSAMADTGSAQNIISAKYASAMKLNVSPGSNSFQLGNSSSIQAIGTVMLDWSFAEKPQERYKLLFHVLPTCIYDVILGRPFLTATETLTKYRRRLTECIFSVFNVLRFGFLGDTYQALEGTLGETTAYKHSVLAGLDTGAECNVMSEAFALRHGYRITRDEVPTFLQFADGSYQETEGQVHIFWTFGSSKQIPISFEILKGCASDVIVGDEFIFDYCVYENYSPYIKEIKSNHDCYELTPFNFFKGWQRAKAKPAVYKTTEDHLAREAEVQRRQNWNMATDYGKLADSSEKLAEKARRDSFQGRDPLLEAAPVQGRVKHAPSILPSRANRHPDVARDGDGCGNPSPQEQVLQKRLRCAFRKVKSLVVGVR